jgi:hypothetical protein
VDELDESDLVEWDPHVPNILRRVLEEQLEACGEEDGNGPVETLARLLDEPTPSLWGSEAQLWLRDKVERLDAARVYRFTQELGAGTSRNDERVSDALAAAGVSLEMVDGRFFEMDEAAEELDVADAVCEPARLLDGRYLPAKRPWLDSQQAMNQRRYEQGVAQAVNALESVVLVVSGGKNIDAGLKTLFPSGERTPLRQAINQLHNYGSAVPQVRHGSRKLSSLTAAEARGACRAAAVWMVMLIDLDKQGAFPVQ